MASDYFTATPEIKAAVEVAAAVGNYTSFQVPVHGSVIPQVGFSVPVEGSAAEYEQEVKSYFYATIKFSWLLFINKVICGFADSTATPVYFDGKFSEICTASILDGSLHRLDRNYLFLMLIY